MEWLGSQRYDGELRAEVSRLGEVAVAQPTATIPTCPEWTMRDLVSHVGSGHRWSAEIVEGRLERPPALHREPAPPDPTAWPAWLTEGAGRLADAVRTTGADTTVWTWQDDRSAGFWLRRMLHDAIIHRFDAESTNGSMGELAPDLAADGVADMLDTVATLSRPPHDKFGALVGGGETLRLEATDPDPTSGPWLAERTPDGVVWQIDDRPATVTVRAPARDLLLILNRRLDPAAAGVEVTGDGALLAHWLEHTRF